MSFLLSNWYTHLCPLPPPSPYVTITLHPDHHQSQTSLPQLSWSSLTSAPPQAASGVSQYWEDPDCTPSHESQASSGPWSLSLHCCSPELVPEAFCVSPTLPTLPCLSLPYCWMHSLVQAWLPSHFHVLLQMSTIQGQSLTLHIKQNLCSLPLSQWPHHLKKKKRFITFILCVCCLCVRKCIACLPDAHRHQGRVTHQIPWSWGDSCAKSWRY